MTSIIRILDEKTINQIAAGEVIESPASVIKELVDNALDAKATKILIEATNSGRQTIRLQDNGSGMSHDDAILCIERHATSKIRRFEDLYGLDTMGFRGEALSSIASISELRLITAPNTQSAELVMGSCVQVSGGKITKHEKVQCLGGTDIEVRSLFFNVPARKKFLKSPAKDASDIIKVVMQLALAHPEVSFELVLNHQREFSLPARSIDERIKELLGSEFFSHLIAIKSATTTGSDNQAISISGYVSMPEHSRPNRAHQYLFINGRPVTSLFVAGCVKEAYGTSLDPVRHPAFVLYITVNPEALDVNVHPQKREVRFHLEEEIKQALLQTVSKTLFVQIPQTPQTLKQTPLSQEFTFSSSVREFQHSAKPFPLEVVTPKFVQTGLVEAKPQFHVQGVCKGYILAEIEWSGYVLPEELNQSGLYLISVKNAKARIAHDALEVRNEVVKGASQTLLVPLFLELSVVESSRLKNHLVVLASLGVFVREFGVSSFLVEAIPSHLDANDVEQALRLIASDENQQPVTEIFAKAIGDSSSRAVVSKELAEQILKKLLSCVNPFVSPFGEKVVALLSIGEMEKKFR